MSVTNITKDPEAATMTVTAEFEAPVERVWQLWADPRQLERWWGPPTYPATVVDHDLSAGGRVAYFMTGPGGDKHHGWWRVVGVEPGTRLEVEDGFADDAGNPTDMPVTHMTVTLAERAEGGTRVEIHSQFPSTEAMAQMIAMGMEEGLREAMGQMDALVVVAG
jgi:uncharacterized protein YndB with AHSA1/START domain